MTHDLFLDRTKETPNKAIKDKAESESRSENETSCKKGMKAYHGQTCGQKVTVAVKMGIQEM